MALIWCLIIPGSRGLIRPGVLLFSNILSILFVVVLKPKNVEFFILFYRYSFIIFERSKYLGKEKKIF